MKDRTAFENFFSVSGFSSFIRKSYESAMKAAILRPAPARFLENVNYNPKELIDRHISESRNNALVRVKEYLLTEAAIRRLEYIATYLGVEPEYLLEEFVEKLSVKYMLSPLALVTKEFVKAQKTLVNAMVMRTGAQNDVINDKKMTHYEDFLANYWKYEFEKLKQLKKGEIEYGDYTDKLAVARDYAFAEYVWENPAEARRLHKQLVQQGKRVYTYDKNRFK